MNTYITLNLSGIFKQTLVQLTQIWISFTFIVGVSIFARQTDFFDVINRGVGTPASDVRTSDAVATEPAYVSEHSIATLLIWGDRSNDDADRYSSFQLPSSLPTVGSGQVRCVFCSISEFFIASFLCSFVWRNGVCNDNLVNFFS